MPVIIKNQLVIKGNTASDIVTPKEVQPSLEVIKEKAMTSQLKVKEPMTSKLIDYKKSSFISDMLQSDKD